MFGFSTLATFSFRLARHLPSPLLAPRHLMADPPSRFIV